MTNETKPDWTTLTARDVMQERVITVSYSAPLSEVERLLADNRIGGVPVTDQTGHVVGVISARDLLDRYTEDPDSRPRRGPGFFHLSSESLDDGDFSTFRVPEESEETAESLMTAEAYTVVASDGLQTVAGLMAHHRIHRVLVTHEETQAIVGLISTLDLIAAFAG